MYFAYRDHEDTFKFQENMRNTADFSISKDATRNVELKYIRRNIVNSIRILFIIAVFVFVYSCDLQLSLKS